MASPETVYCDDTDETLGDVSSDSGTIITAWEVPDLSTSRKAHMYFNVFDAAGGPVPDDATITSASFWAYVVSYSYAGTKPTTNPHQGVQIYDGSLYVDILDSAAAPDTGQYVEYVMPALAYAEIGSGDSVNGPGYDTEIKCYVDSPGGTSAYRKWEIAAYENTGGGEAGDWAAYLVVAYTEAGEGTPRVVIISV